MRLIVHLDAGQVGRIAACVRAPLLQERRARRDCLGAHAARSIARERAPAALPKVHAVESLCPVVEQPLTLESADIDLRAFDAPQTVGVARCQHAIAARTGFVASSVAAGIDHR